MSSLRNDRKPVASVQGPLLNRAPVALVRPDTGRGRILYVRDVVELLGNAKSEWWVRNNFAPESRFKVGRLPAWWESDAYAWLDAQRRL
jgi:hypothetical protein